MLETFTLKKLQAACRDAGWRGFWGKNKADLIEWISKSTVRSAKIAVALTQPSEVEAPSGEIHIEEMYWPDEEVEAPGEVEISSGEIEIEFQYAGRAKPIPEEEPWNLEESEVEAPGEKAFFIWAEKLGSYYQLLCNVFKEELEKADVLKKVSLEDLQAACKAAGVRCPAGRNKTRLLEWLFHCPELETILSHLSEESASKEDNWPSVEGFLNPEEEDEDDSWPWHGEEPWFLEENESNSDEEEETPKTEDCSLSEFWKKYRDGLPQVGSKSISFGWTSKELLAGLKSATRRTWKACTAEYFRRKFEEGIRFFPARDKSHYAKNGKQIGWIELTTIPYQQQLSKMSRADLVAEGFPVLSIKYSLPTARKKFMEKFFNGKDQVVWVVEFKFHRELPQSRGLRVTPSDFFEIKAG